MSLPPTIMPQPPRVSVVLPVYNGERHLAAAIDSILGQSFGDFELIAIDDGSTDGTAAMLDAVGDPRMRVVHQPNAGLAQTLNRGVALARGAYIARQDADDVSLPDRLARQVAYLDAHPACGLLGTWSRILQDEQETGRGHRHPTDNGELQIRSLFDSFFVHSSVMLRRSAIEQCGAYPTDPERNPPEDFDLWLRIAHHFSLANLPEVHLLYREVAGSISRTKADLLQRRAIAIATENLGQILGSEVPETQLRDLVALLRHAPASASPRPDWRGLERLLGRIESHMLERWPAEREAVARGAAELRATLRRTRLRPSFARSAIGGLSRIIRAFV